MYKEGPVYPQLRTVRQRCPLFTRLRPLHPQLRTWEAPPANVAPAKELQRQLGVTYKTAWRMGHEIRKYMGEVDGIPPMTGHVEVDETYVGGRRPKIKGFTGRRFQRNSNSPRYLGRCLRET